MIRNATSTSQRRRTTPPKKGSRGYTLVELTIALAVSGILVTSATASIQGATERKQLIHAARTIESDLNLIRQEALTTNSSMVLSWVAGTNWCYGVDTGSCDCSIAADCSVTEVAGTAVAPRISMANASFDGASEVTFERVRGMPSAAGNIDLQSASGIDLRVELLTLGHTRVCSPSDSVAGYPAC